MPRMGFLTKDMFHVEYFPAVVLAAMRGPK